MLSHSSRRKRRSGSKSYKYFQTLHTKKYENITLRDFLDSELMKIDHFIVKPEHALDSNRNSNLFQWSKNIYMKHLMKIVNKKII
ncbi:DUF3900 domain-containing protein [Metabacillus fastidiosus]|uniref:DUF3900 domain-containing protein n=1 Tax=Metabacillus fastidiosus TaxID=1458 RepID=UPI003D27BB65